MVVVDRHFEVGSCPFTHTHTHKSGRLNSLNQCVFWKVKIYQYLLYLLYLSRNFRYLCFT